MTGKDVTGLVVPELRVYDACHNEDIILRNVGVDPDYVRDADGRVIYFDVNEGQSYLAEQGKSMPSLPLLVNLYIALSHLTTENEMAAQFVNQLNNAWDRTSTSINPSGTITHADAILGDITCEGFTVPQQGRDISLLFSNNKRFFQTLLGVRDIDRLAEIAAWNDLVPFYWYPRGERRAMFGGGDFYHMHQYIPGLLMVFCDDEPHPRRVLRGVWQER
jgi:hypothetical protein